MKKRPTDNKSDKLLAHARTWLSMPTTIKLVAIFAVALSFASCASPERRVEEKETVTLRHTDFPIIYPPVAKGKTGSAYSKAEQLFLEGKYNASAKAFINYVESSRPNDRFIDHAYFMAGVSRFEAGRIKDGLFHFRSIVLRFRDSELYTQALINSGISHFHLNNMEEADNYFKRAYPLATSPDLKAYIHFYEAWGKEKKGHFYNAVSDYIKAESLAQNGKLINTAKERVERIAHNFLGEKELENMAQEHSGRWPAKIALGELLNIYRRDTNPSLTEKTQRELGEQFPLTSKPSLSDFDDSDEKITSTPRVGVVIPLTGTGSKAGREILQGIQLAFKSFNDLVREKGVLPVIKDSEGSPEIAEEAMSELAGDSDILVTIGPAFSQSFTLSADIAENSGMPVLSPSATQDGLAEKSDKLFRNTVTGRLEATQIAEFALYNLDLRRFAVIYPDTKSGYDTFVSFLKHVELLGGEVVAVEPYDINQMDFKDQIKSLGGLSDDELRKSVWRAIRRMPDLTAHQINERLEESRSDTLTAPQIGKYKLPLTKKSFRPKLSIRYDSILILGRYDKIALIIPELEFYNLKGITKLAGRGANHPEFPKIAEKFAEGTIFMDGFFVNDESPIIKNFVRDYSLAFYEKPTILSAQAYDAARIVLSGVARGVSSRKEMTNYLKNLQFFEGVSGVISMDPSGDVNKALTVLTVKNGQIVKYEPEESLDEPSEQTPDNSQNLQVTDE